MLTILPKVMSPTRAVGGIKLRDSCRDSCCACVGVWVWLVCGGVGAGSPLVLVGYPHLGKCPPQIRRWLGQYQIAEKAKVEPFITHRTE